MNITASTHPVHDPNTHIGLSEYEIYLDGLDYAKFSQDKKVELYWSPTVYLFTHEDLFTVNSFEEAIKNKEDKFLKFKVSEYGFYESTIYINKYKVSYIKDGILTLECGSTYTLLN